MRISNVLLRAVYMSAALGCSSPSEPTKPAVEATAAEPVQLTAAALRTRAKALFAPLPAVMESPKHKLTPEKIDLGHKLYFDTRLSRGQELSCASCHDLNGYGIDTRPEAIKEGRSFGHKKQLGER